MGMASQSLLICPLFMGIQVIMNKSKLSNSLKQAIVVSLAIVSSMWLDISLSQALISMAFPTIHLAGMQYIQLNQDLKLTGI